MQNPRVGRAFSPDIYVFNLLDLISILVEDFMSPERKEAGRKVLDRVSDAFMALDRDWRFTYVNDEAVKNLRKSKNEILGDKLLEVFPEAENTVFEEKYRYAMENQEVVYFEGYYPPLDSWFSVNVYPSESGISIYFKDVTPRKEDDRRLRNNLERQREARDLLRMVLEDEDPINILHEAARIVSEGLGNEFGGILMLEENGSDLSLTASYGMKEIEMGSSVAIEDSKYLRQLFKDKDPVTVKYSEDEIDNLPDWLRSLDIHSAVQTIIGRYNEPWGVIATGSRRHRSYHDEEIEFVQNIANILGIALDRDNSSKVLESREISAKNTDSEPSGSKN